MPFVENIFATLSTEAPSMLDCIRVGSDEVVVVPFTQCADQVDLHFMKGPEFNGYTLCNGSGCPACMAGISIISRFLFPVYDPTEGRVRVLPVPSSKSPHSLLPQLHRETIRGERVAIFINRADNQKYVVTSAALPEDARDGADEISEFLKKFESGEIDLTSVFPKIDNATMAALPSISRKLELKGIKVDAA